MTKASTALRDFIGNEMLRRRAAQIVDRMPEFATNPPDAPVVITRVYEDRVDESAVAPFLEALFLTALATHANAAYRDVETIFDGLSPCLHDLVGSAEGRRALSYIMTQPGTPLLPVTSH